MTNLYTTYIRNFAYWLESSQEENIFGLLSYKGSVGWYYQRNNWGAIAKQ